MEESRSVTSWVNRLYFEWPRALSFLGLRLAKTRHRNLVPLLFGVKPHPRVGSGRYSEPITVKCPVTHEKINAHRELTVTTVVTAPGPNDHSSVTARSQFNHGEISMITAQSRLGHSSITAQVTAQSRLAVTILVTVSSRWAHCEFTVSSPWAVTVANFFLMGTQEWSVFARGVQWSVVKVIAFRGKINGPLLLAWFTLV